MANVAITTFSGGEQSPKIHERVDTEKNASGCKKLENMFPTIYGGAERRPGLYFIGILETPEIT
jgi:hypothetical protein